jgi:hypothetical protein
VVRGMRLKQWLTFFSKVQRIASVVFMTKTSTGICRFLHARNLFNYPQPPATKPRSKRDILPSR